MRAKQLEGYDIGSIPPATPRVGDRWMETASNGVPLYAWDWVWDSARWVSPEQLWNLSCFGLELLRADFLDVGFRTIQLLDFRSNLFHSIAQTSSNHWRIEIYHRNRGPNSTLPLSTLTTTNVGSTAFTLRSEELSGVLRFPQAQTNLSDATLLEVRIIPVGSPGSLVGTVRLRYQFAR